MNPTLPSLLRLQHALAVENGELVQLARQAIGNACYDGE
jgi:hypothetical protein